MGVFLYDETIHVPMGLFKLLQQGSAGIRIENRVELVDILPTLLQVVGIAVPAEVQGGSLLELMKTGALDAGVKEAWRDRPAYAQADYTHLAYGWSALQSWRTGKYLYVQAPRRELYEEVSDPKAEHNLALSSAAVADTLASQMEAFRQKTISTRQAPKADLDPARERQLAALGYVVSASNIAKAGASEQGADPKDKIAAANIIRRLSSVMEEGRLQEAIPLLQQLIGSDPGMPMLHFKLGECYLQLREYEKAVPEFRKAVELEPDFAAARINLGRALLQLHDFDGAVAVFEQAVTRTPTLLDAHLFLEVSYAQANRLPEAIKECEKVLESSPEHYGSNLNLGRFLAQSGQLELALVSLQKAAALQPGTPVPHMYLADVYTKLGRQADAQREQAEAQQLAESARKK